MEKQIAVLRNFLCSGFAKSANRGADFNCCWATVPVLPGESAKLRESCVWSHVGRVSTGIPVHLAHLLPPSLRRSLGSGCLLRWHWCLGLSDSCICHDPKRCLFNRKHLIRLICTANSVMHSRQCAWSNLMRAQVETKEVYDTLRELSVSISIHHNGSCSTCTEKPVSHFNEPTKNVL